MSSSLPTRSDGRMTATLSTGSVVSGEAQYVEQAIAIDQRFQQEERSWVARLRAQGIKAAHPDDGWVHRDTNKIHLEYPQFNDGLGVGDLLALGWAHRRDYRIVRVTKVEPVGRLIPMTYYHFNEVARIAPTPPEPERRRRWWQRGRRS